MTIQTGMIFKNRLLNLRHQVTDQNIRQYYNLDFVANSFNCDWIQLLSLEFSLWGFHYCSKLEYRRAKKLTQDDQTKRHNVLRCDTHFFQITSLLYCTPVSYWWKELLGRLGSKQRNNIKMVLKEMDETCVLSFIYTRWFKYDRGWFFL
jgi:hypothetical protein